MNETTVSVIVPTYNSGRYIAQCIDSVLDQTHRPAEILIVDDGSKDDTRAIVSAYRDPRIRYIEAPHRGAAAARNRALEVARGKYLAFLDADDLWRPAMLERQVSVMEHDPLLVCCFTNFVRFMDGTGEVLPDQFTFFPELATLPVAGCAGGKARIVDGDAFVQLIGFHDIPAYTVCMMFRRALVAEVRQNESLGRCEDLEYAARAFMRGKVAFIREVLVDVRRHDSNVTGNISLMALDKLSAMLSLQSAVDTPVRRAALNDRLVKARIDAATALIRSGRRLRGLEHYTKALTVPGSGLRKLKGAARIGYELVTCAADKEPTITPGATGSRAPADAAWQTTPRH